MDAKFGEEKHAGLELFRTGKGRSSTLNWPRSRHMKAWGKDGKFGGEIYFCWFVLLKETRGGGGNPFIPAPSPSFKVSRIFTSLPRSNSLLLPHRWTKISGGSFQALSSFWSSRKYFWAAAQGMKMILGKRQWRTAWVPVCPQCLPGPRSIRLSLFFWPLSMLPSKQALVRFGVLEESLR